MPDMNWEAQDVGSAGPYKSYALSVNGHHSALLTMLPEEWQDFAARLGLVEGQDEVWRSEL